MTDSQPSSPKPDPSSPKNKTPSSPKQVPSSSTCNPQITPKQASSSSAPEIAPPAPREKVLLTFHSKPIVQQSKPLPPSTLEALQAAAVAAASSLSSSKSTLKTKASSSSSQGSSSQGSSSINPSLEEFKPIKFSQGSSSVNPSSTPSHCLTLIDSLQEFKPIKFRVDDLDNYCFYKVVLWMKSAHPYYKLDLSRHIDDWPPLGIHGFFPVWVSRGDGNKIIPGDHDRLNEEFIDDKISVIKPELNGQIKIFWPSLYKRNTTAEFLRSQAWKHNRDVGMFPDNKDYIEKGLKLGIHLINKISSWTESKYGYNTGNRLSWIGYRDELHTHLEFLTDCRFQRLEYEPTLYGLKKIGMMGILIKKKQKQWKWNPVDIQVNEDFIQDDEKPDEEHDKFILEHLAQSIQKRRYFYRKRTSGVESSFRPNKRC